METGSGVGWRAGSDVLTGGAFRVGDAFRGKRGTMRRCQKPTIPRRQSIQAVRPGMREKSINRKCENPRRIK